MNLKNCFECSSLDAKSCAIHFVASDHERKYLYEEVNRLQEKLSEFIRKSSCRNTVIAIYVKEYALIPICLVSILKSENCFVVIDEAWPCKRIEFLVHKIKPGGFIVSPTLREKFFSAVDLSYLIELKFQDGKEVDFVFFSNKTEYCLYETIAYIALTSGSTGAPKTVYVTHNSIVPNIHDLRQIWNVKRFDIVLQSTPFTFDPSVVEVFVCFLAGATLLMVSPILKLSPAKFSSVIDNYKANHLQLTSSMFRLIEDYCSFACVKTLTLGGENFPAKSATLDRLIQKNVELYNIYGITEMSCWSSIHRVKETDLIAGRIPVGVCLSDTHFRLLCHCSKNELHNHCLLEINSETRRCYVNDFGPVNNDAYSCVTNDLFSSDIDGSLFWCGRSDNVVKRFGQRINLIDIANVALKSGCTFAYCMLINEKLVLFVKGSESHKIKKKLENSTLTYSHIPDEIIFVDTYKVNQHGKLDRSFFRLLYENRAAAKTNPTRAEVERSLESAWTEILDISPTMDATFLSSGGNSIKSLQLLVLLENKFAQKFPSLVQLLLGDFRYHLLLRYVWSLLSIKKRSTHKHFTHLSKLSRMKHVGQFMRLQAKNDNFLLGQELNLLSKREECCVYGRCNFFFGNTNYNDSHRSCIESPDRFEFTCTWKYNMDKCVDASPLVVKFLSDGDVKIFIGSHGKRFDCITMGGRTAWSFATKDRVEASSVLVDQGIIVIGDYSGTLYFIDCVSGKLLYSICCNDCIKSTPCYSYATKMLYFGSHDTYVRAVDLSNLQQCFAFSVDGSSIFASPVLSCDKCFLIVCTLAGSVCKLDAIKGKMQWRFDCKNPVFSSPALSESYVLVGCTNSFLYCIDYNGGYVTDRIYFGSHDNNIYCVNAINGSLIWKHMTDSHVYSSPTIIKTSADRELYYVLGCSCKGVMYLLRSNDGTVICDFHFPQDVYSSPVFFDGKIFIGCRDNFLYCIELRPLL